MTRALVIALLVLTAVSCRHRKHETKTVRPQSSSKPVAAPSKPSSADDDDWQRALGVTPRQFRESRLYSFIGEWYGTPYKYGGCIKSGVDCSCFASLLSEKVYNRHLPRSANDMYLQADKFGIDDAREGDLLFFRINSKTVTHVGIYLGRKMFVHASTSRGVSVSSLDEAYYRKYFFCAGRVKGK
jgi:lipoprotein Spr